MMARHVKGLQHLADVFGQKPKVSRLPQLSTIKSQPWEHLQCRGLWFVLLTLLLYSQQKLWPT